MTQKTAAFFNGDYAADPLSEAEIDAMYSTKKDRTKRARELINHNASLPEHSALVSAAKGGLLGGGLGGLAALAATRDPIAAAAIGGLGALVSGALAGGARSLSNTEIRKAKQLKNVDDSTLERMVLERALQDKLNREHTRHASLVAAVSRQ